MTFLINIKPLSKPKADDRKCFLKEKIMQRKRHFHSLFSKTPLIEF